MSPAAMVSVMLTAAAALLFAFLYVSALSRIKAERADAVRRSRAVSAGNFTQHMVPYFPEFEFDPRDVRFLGSPIDFVVFDGLTEGVVRRVVLVEVKTGMSNLSARERSVRDAIRAGRVDWLELRAAVPAG